MFAVRKFLFSAKVLKRARRGNVASCICSLATSCRSVSLRVRSRGATPSTTSSAEVDVLAITLELFSNMLLCTFSRGAMDALVAHQIGYVLVM